MKSVNNSVSQKYNFTLKPISKTNYTGIYSKKINCDQVSFKSSENQVKKESGKNVFPAVASLFITGSGQILNGEVGKGLAILGGTMAIGGTIGATMGMAGLPLAGLVGIASGLYSAVDAYNYKPENKK